MSIKDIVLIALFAAFTAALGLFPPIPVPLIPVPIAAQSLGFMLAGALLGGHRAFFMSIIFWILVAIGLPVLTGGTGGLGPLFGPTGGYIFGYGFSALFIGFLYDRIKSNSTPFKEITILIAGCFVIYIFGILWLLLTSQVAIGWLIKGNLAFLPGDGVKVVFVYTVHKVLQRAVPGVL